MPEQYIVEAKVCETVKNSPPICDTIRSAPVDKGRAHQMKRLTKAKVPSAKVKIRKA